MTTWKYLTREIHAFFISQSSSNALCYPLIGFESTVATANHKTYWEHGYFISLYSPVLLAAYRQYRPLMPPLPSSLTFQETFYLAYEGHQELDDPITSIKPASRLSSFMIGLFSFLMLFDSPMIKPDERTFMNIDKLCLGAADAFPSMRITVPTLLANRSTSVSFLTSFVPSDSVKCW